MDHTQLSNAATEEDYLKESVEIVPEAIREEFVRVPADLAYWGERYADAVRGFLVAEQYRKETYARARLSIINSPDVRERAALEGYKLTEATVDALIETLTEYRDAKLAEIEAEAGKTAARLRYDAVSAKKDMIMSLGAHQRAEMSPIQITGRRD